VHAHFAQIEQRHLEFEAPAALGEIAAAGLARGLGRAAGIQQVDEARRAGESVGLVASAVKVRSQARDAYQAYRSAYDIAQHYRRDVLPLRQIISDEMLLRYNAMQVDVFALLAEARQRIASNTAAIAADRDFWLAETDLRAVIAGGFTGSAAEPTAPTFAAASAAGHD
jgi:outer membrane protein TolC